MYCSKKSCFNEPCPMADNHMELCEKHYNEAKENLDKMAKLDYSKMQDFERRVKK